MNFRDTIYPYRYGKSLAAEFQLDLIVMINPKLRIILSSGQIMLAYVWLWDTRIGRIPDWKEAAD